MIMSLVLQNQWLVLQWDVEGAFLNADIEHDLYVTDEGGEVWQLKKALYGLKQAGHEWCKKLRRMLEESGLKQMVSDEGCYIGPNARIATHVDDLLVTVKDKAESQKILETLRKHVKIEEKGTPSKFLGIMSNLRIKKYG